MNYEASTNKNGNKVEVWERKEGDKVIQIIAERHKDYTTSREVVYYPKKYYPHEGSPIVVSCKYHPRLLTALILWGIEHDKKHPISEEEKLRRHLDKHFGEPANE